MMHKLYKSQQEAIDFSIAYFQNTQDKEPVILWNALMRWGKCLTSLNFIYQWNQKFPDNKIENVLIGTFFPQTEDSWSSLILPNGNERQDNFSNYNFVTVKNPNPKKGKINIFFASFQELYTGKEKKNIFYQQNYQLIILDEYHHGAYNAKAKNEFEQFNNDDDYEKSESSIQKIKFDRKLVLSGTPYKVFGIDQFTEDNTFTFSYFNEQIDKLEKGDKSDYKTRPTLNLKSVQLKYEENLDQLEEKVKFLLTNNFAFSNFNQNFNKLFSQQKASSFWLIPSVESASLIQSLIEKYDVNNIFNVINLYNGKYKDSDKTLEYVREDIKISSKYNIILSFNKLTLGVTIPEIETVVFLREITSPELYMQAACRSKSQYPKEVGFYKENVHLFTFDRITDFTVFSTIVNTKYSRNNEQINEEKFLKCLPIDFINYNNVLENYEEIKCTSNESFLDSLAHISIDMRIKRGVGRIDSLKDIPRDILEELSKISQIGGIIKKPIPKREMIITEEDNAKREGRQAGRKDYETGQTSGREVPSHLKHLSNYYLEGYKDGYKDPGEKKPKNEEESDNPEPVKQRIELLLQRFIYVTIATYFVEGRFLDIKEASEEFFKTLLGFPKEMFIRLYNLNYINQNEIDAIVNSFRSTESTNTNYIGFKEKTDYVISDTEESIQETLEKLNISELKEFLKEFNDEVYPENTTKHFIYVAKPSAWILQLKETFENFYNGVLKQFKIKEIDLLIEDLEILSTGTKIGETSRIPKERIEELNGYTRKISGNPLFDLVDYREVDINTRDTEFHNYLESKGYIRFKDNVRKEIFDIDASTALKELDLFMKK
jgi:hypothetical protein